MTAEVGVLNRLGVALAADSAVSIGRSAEKIWTSADKLFHLSRSAPVGVMVYGNASLAGIPWETIVKEFRASLDKTKYNRLESYAERFFSFIKANRALFPRAAQDAATNFVIEALLLDVRQKAADRLTTESERRNGLDEAEISPIVRNEVFDRLKEIRTQPFLKGFSVSVRKTVRRRHLPAASKARTKVFGKLPIDSPTARAIEQIAIEMLCRSYLGPARGGIVVAGFGERDPTPSLLAYNIEEFAAGRPRCGEPNRTSMGPTSDAAIVPFAQQEMVHSFLRGVDVDLSVHMQRSTSVLFDGTIAQVLKSVGNVNPDLHQLLDKSIRPAVAGMLKELFADWEAQSARRWRPVLSMVASLPKDELAAMAEALVNLTKFRRRITPERETVGGPIDVAVITKGDGFVWVKRKHYFDASLNPRVIARYSNEG